METAIFDFYATDHKPHDGHLSERVDFEGVDYWSVCDHAEKHARDLMERWKAPGVHYCSRDGSSFFVHANDPA